MPWTFQYSGEALIDNLTLESMQSLSDQILSFSNGGGGWFDLQFPNGDGIGMHRFWVRPGVAMLFQETSP
ncbi:MAG: hypothetical protein JWN80_1387 [Microbacteriaceae bacterium]|nr:hypothetical protein [Microbacteriaceae bacterium]